MNDSAIQGAASTRTAGAPDARLPSLPDQDDVPGGGEVVFPPNAGVAEVALLLPGGQAAALERAAHRRGLTVGQLIRRLIRGCLAGEGHPDKSGGGGRQAE
jgi:hypothetical protein